MKFWSKRTIQLSVSVVLITALLWQVDLRRVLELLEAVKGSYILLSFFCIFLTRLLMPIKWWILFSVLEKLSIFQSVRIYFVSSFLGQFFPSTIGADLTRVFLLNREGASTVKVAASIFIERSIGLFITLLAGFLAVAGWLMMIRSDPNVLLEVLFIVVFVALVAILIALRMRLLVGRALTKIANNLREKNLFKESAENFAVLAREAFLKMLPRIPAFAALTLLEFVLAIVSVYYCARAFDITASPALWLVIPIYFLIIRLPIAFSGLGLHELSLLYLLSNIGVAAETGLAVGVVHHLLLVLAILPGALFRAGDRAI